VIGVRWWTWCGTAAGGHRVPEGVHTLLAENTPVTTVAYRCGWASASTFIHVFHTTFGHTPCHPTT